MKIQALVTTLAVLAPLAALAAPADNAQEILDTTGIQGGLILHLGSGDGELTAALRANDAIQVQGLDTDPKNVQAARKTISEKNLYGDVSVDLLMDDRLPYIDNLLNLVVSENPGDISDEEILRVLTPKGIAYIKRDGEWTLTEKPRPDGMDEWTHFMHDPSGNAVAHDDIVGPPRHAQWLGTPRWSRHHDRMASMSALVTGGGRMFYIMDEGSRTSILLPPKWTLIARDAFNGAILWRQPIESWHSHLWPLKSGPTSLARRLITTGDRVYVTLGLYAPLTAIDAATGEIIRTYDETDSTEEAIISNGIIFALANDDKWALDDFGPVENTGDQARVRSEYQWNEKPRKVVAIDAETGKLLWDKESIVAPLTLTADDDRVFYHDGTKVVCLERGGGEEVWSSDSVDRKTVFNFNFGAKLVLYDGIVLFAGGDRNMTAMDARTGKKLWTAPHAQSGYQSPEDLLVAAGLVWSAPTTKTGDTGVFTGRDPKTGEVKEEFPPNVETYWFHHRCHIAKATDKFLMPSRTGIEFIDHENETWDINHWVRGGCLYGVLPANGLTYAPPHNCACYPETKLYGFNALAGSSPTRQPVRESDPTNRLQKGPAFGKIEPPASSTEDQADWPTYRGTNSRAGFTPDAISANLTTAWETKLGGKLTATTTAHGKLYVAQPDQHTLHALDLTTGEPLWSYITGGRIDSPPTIHNGAVLFGCADGYVYALRESDGELAWRFRGAPMDQRMTAFEQIESVWPIHGSVLVENNVLYTVAGRSNFLDGGLRFIRLNPETGELIDESPIDEINPDTGNNIQEKIAILQMPVGLPDILSSDGEHVYMRSQRFDLEGTREEIGPVSSEFAVQGGTHSGEGPHLFAPMGFLDDTWFHRSYWVYGKNFAGGHGGYYQAGKYAPSGRILVFNDKDVFGFGRKPEYLKWTTTLEHQLFSAAKEAPEVDLQSVRRGGATSVIEFESSDALNPARKPLVVTAWVKAEGKSGAIVSHGGDLNGYALALKAGVPQFLIRTNKELASISGEDEILNKWTHLAGVLAEDGSMELFVNGQSVAAGKSKGLLTKVPVQGLNIGADTKSVVGNYKTPFAYGGLIDEVKIYHGDITPAEVAALSEGTNPANADLVLACDFEGGSPKDSSGYDNHGQAQGTVTSRGRNSDAVAFSVKANRQGGSAIQPHWTEDLPLLVRSMALTGDTLFICGPPDIVDEEESFQKLTEGDPKVHAVLEKQDDALAGKHGGILRAVSASNGSQLAELKLDAIPVWDGLTPANNNLYLTTTDGRILCLSAPN
ncbi:MAG: PQQ-binding-like beta-propeller repeat protein [Verrucomicrobiota bacterium]